jgi:hypothetical protein
MKNAISPYVKIIMLSSDQYESLRKSRDRLMQIKPISSSMALAIKDSLTKIRKTLSDAHRQQHEARRKQV